MKINKLKMKLMILKFYVVISKVRKNNYKINLIILFKKQRNLIKNQINNSKFKSINVKIRNKNCKIKNNFIFKKSNNYKVRIIYKFFLRLQYFNTILL